MKQNMMFTDYPEVNDKSAASMANLDKLQNGLMIGLGAVLTYGVLAVSSPEPFFDSFASVFLWLMLLLAPAAAGIVVLKFPSWQHLPLAQRKNVILHSFGLSLLALCTTVLFSFQWHPYEAGHWLVSALVTLSYGSFILWLHFRLSRQGEREIGDLFP